MPRLLGSEDPAARLAVETYCYRARKYIGAHLAVPDGADAILFGGGVGENAPAVREKILSELLWMGIALDPGANRAAVGREVRISNGGSEIEVWVIPVNEAELLAEEALAMVRSREAVSRKEGMS